MSFLHKKIISAQDVSRWKQAPGVVQIIPEVSLPGSVGLELKWKETKQPVRMGMGETMRGFLLQESLEPTAGTLELPETGGIVLSKGAAQSVGVSNSQYAQIVGQNVEVTLHTSRGETQSYPLRVVGVSQAQTPEIKVSIADRIAMKNWWFNTPNTLEREGYDLVTIRSSDVTHAKALTAQIKKEGFGVQSLEIVVEVANRIVSAITVMSTLIGSIALLVATIGIANTMVMAIYERTREIGILKAMGASSAEIRQMFMLEAGFIGLIGGLMGLFLGWLVGLAMNQLIPIFLKYQQIPVHGDFFVVTLTLAGGVLLFATLIGLVAGLLPAQRAARLDPLQALRHE